MGTGHLREEEKKDQRSKDNANTIEKLGGEVAHPHEQKGGKERGGKKRWGPLI